MGKNPNHHHGVIFSPKRFMGRENFTVNEYKIVIKKQCYIPLLGWFIAYEIIGQKNDPKIGEINQTVKEIFKKNRLFFKKQPKN